MRKFILKSKYALGDIVLMTAVVRDLHIAYPEQLQIDVRTSFPEVWKYNPFLTRLHDYDPEATIVNCGLPLVHHSNHSACHALHGPLQFLNQYLGTNVRLTKFKGDIHLSRRECNSPSPLRQLVGASVPYWLISAGGRFDNTIKWWDVRRYQEVVNHFRGRVQFVQVGHSKDYHPELGGVIDLRGQTSVRKLINLIYHAEGVLCGVTSLMHLAAAVPARLSALPNRPCVVVAGGRESPCWEAYPGHQFLHTVGMLPCCATGGCWRARTVALGDRAIEEKPEHLCNHVRNGLPLCMDLIKSTDVIQRIETYLESGSVRPLQPGHGRMARRAVSVNRANGVERPLNICTAHLAAERRIVSLSGYPGGFKGRGLVICAGGVRLFSSAWVCINMLRHFGCRLPIELWHLGQDELDSTMCALVKPLGVECVDAFKLLQKYPARLLHGWSLKPYSILHSPFKEVILLDADNVPLANPEKLFETPQYRRTGAIFWPDYGRLTPKNPAWKVFGVPYRHEPEFETGQIVVNKEACWDALNLCMWYNEQSDFYYRYVYGDKDTFHMAFRKLGQPYAMPSTPLSLLGGAFCQHDFHGRRIFQHRTSDKWRLIIPNKRMRGFFREKLCRKFLDQLSQKWDARKSLFRRSTCSPSNLKFRPRPKRVVRLTACMISCHPREKMRARTLTRLRQTDWGGAPLLLALDEQRFFSFEENLAHSAWSALKQCLATPADYVLCLGDNLIFNRHLLYNLRHWPPLHTGEIAFASLSNPGVRELAWDLSRHATLAEPQSSFGAEAVLISRALAKFFVEHWLEGPTELHLKWKFLANTLKLPMFLHTPSLCQPFEGRRPREAMWRRADDFKRLWKTSLQCNRQLPIFIPAPGAILL